MTLFAAPNRDYATRGQGDPGLRLSLARCHLGAVYGRGSGTGLAPGCARFMIGSWGWARRCVTRLLAQFVRAGIGVDAAEGFMEVARQGSAAVVGVCPGLDLGGVVAAGGAGELRD